MPKTPKHAYPHAPREDVTETLHGVSVPDPYRWLEDPKSERTVTWMAAEDAAARQALADVPAREPLRRRLTELLYHDAIFAPFHRGGRYFYSRRHSDKEKAVVYWKQGEHGDERVLFDPNQLSDDGSVSLVGWYPSRDGTLVAYKLSRNNADEATMYVRDVASGTDLPHDVIEGAKYAGASWTPDGKGFYYTFLPTDESIPVADRPGYAEVRHHTIGTDPKTDVLVHPATRNPSQFIGVDVSRDGRFLILEVQHGWTSNDVYFRPLDGATPPAAREGQAVGEGWTPLTVGRSSLFDVGYWRGHFYVSTNEGAPRYHVLKVDPRTPAREAWREIVPESDAKLDSFQIVGEHLVLNYLRNALSEVEIRDLEGNLVRKQPLPGLGTTTGMYGNPDEDDAYFYYSSYVEVPQILKTSIATGQTSQWAKIEYPIDTSTLVAEQVFYASKDGTRVSMFVMRQRHVTPDGQRPTLLYGYGGFNNKMTPWFSASIVAWLELGGVYAIANLRGGGEYGEDWHRDGMLEKKQNVFDDFVAAGEFFIAQGWTKPEKLAIHGGSNGGLLVGAAMTQRPELFGAVVCAVPLLDMVRYHRFGSGKTWISEYGSADNAAQFPALYAYSPYHHVREGTAYPALLMLSADSDDRVDPLHARKFAAAIQWASTSDKPALLRIETHAGHGGGDMVKKDVERVADMYAFLTWQLGVTVPAT